MAIVMTGATAGIGLVAARQIRAAGHELIIGARAPDAAAGALSGACVRLLDLAALASVCAFAREVSASGPIEALVLNAGLQLTKPRMSQDRFELTFAVNHLAHYVLARLLAPTLAPGARVVFTASGTHDPAERTGIPAPRHADAQPLAFPDRILRATRIRRPRAAAPTRRRNSATS